MCGKCSVCGECGLCCGEEGSGRGGVCGSCVWSCCCGYGCRGYLLMGGFGVVGVGMRGSLGMGNGNERLFKI